MSSSASRKLAAACAAITMLAAAHAEAITVSTNGVDSGSCGSDVPCATMAQAIANAADGDSIALLPGRYAGATVNKPLSLYSYGGTGGAVITSVLAVTANDVSIGGSGKGLSFEGTGALLTIAGDEAVVRGNAFSGDGTSTCLEVTSGSAAVIRDNTFDDCLNGVDVVAGTATTIRGNRFGFATAAVKLDAGSSAAIVRENRSSSPNGSGFVIDGSDHLFFRNVVHGTPGGGFTTTGAPTNCELKENLVISSGSPGIYLTTGSGWVLNKNAVVNNATSGFYLTANSTFVLNGNLAIGNQGYGFLVSAGGAHVITNNSAIDNGADGMLLAPTGPVTVTGGNLYGNGGANCGLSDSSAFAVTANGIYWGASGGPGADPADGLCANIGAISVNDPADKPAKMKMPTIK